MQYHYLYIIYIVCSIIIINNDLKNTGGCFYVLHKYYIPFCRKDSSVTDFASQEGSWNHPTWTPKDDCIYMLLNMHWNNISSFKMSDSWRKKQDAYSACWVKWMRCLICRRNILRRHDRHSWGDEEVDLLCVVSEGKMTRPQQWGRTDLDSARGRGLYLRWSWLRVGVRSLCVGCSIWVPWPGTRMPLGYSLIAQETELKV